MFYSRQQQQTKCVRHAGRFGALGAHRKAMLRGPRTPPKNAFGFRMEVLAFAFWQEGILLLLWTSRQLIMPVLGELFYFTLPAPELTKSKSFYSTVFRWKIGGGSLGGHVASPNTPHGLSPCGRDNDVYFFTKDLEESMKLVQQQGGKILSQADFESVGKAAFCQDNQGTHFALQFCSSRTKPGLDGSRRESQEG